MFCLSHFSLLKIFIPFLEGVFLHVSRLKKEIYTNSFRMYKPGCLEDGYLLVLSLYFKNFLMFLARWCRGINSTDRINPYDFYKTKRDPLTLRRIRRGVFIFLQKKHHFNIVMKKFYIFSTNL